MVSAYPAIDLQAVTTIPIESRMNKVNAADFACLPRGNFDIGHFIDALPRQLKGNEFRELINLLKLARNNRKPIIWMMGAHVIKVGLSPLIIELMRTGFITAIAMNGAGAIHDSELARGYGTSEDVEQNLKDGSFGMARETGEFLNSAAAWAQTHGLGFGEAVGSELLNLQCASLDNSIFAWAYQLRIPVTVHIAIGTDIIHQHPNVDGAALGETSMRDFKIFAQVVSRLNNGGVVMNVGSNVILPEVFLKALTVARNIGHEVTNFTTANFDMIQHYRPLLNVVKRPLGLGGQGFSFTGHHELMIPLLTWALLHDLA